MHPSPGYHNVSHHNFRMGALITPPHNVQHPHNFQSSVVGRFYGPQPLHLNYVQNVINTQWQS